MRVLPCTLVAKTEDESVELARESSKVMHPHARCVDACGLYSRLVWHALSGANNEDLVQCLKIHSESLKSERR